jgi:hypothetical protein
VTPIAAGLAEAEASRGRIVEADPTPLIAVLADPSYLLLTED